MFSYEKKWLKKVQVFQNHYPDMFWHIIAKSNKHLKVLKDFNCSLFLSSKLFPPLDVSPKQQSGLSIISECLVFFLSHCLPNTEQCLAGKVRLKTGNNIMYICANHRTNQIDANLPFVTSFLGCSDWSFTETVSHTHTLQSLRQVFFFWITHLLWHLQCRLFVLKMMQGIAFLPIKARARFDFSLSLSLPLICWKFF